MERFEPFIFLINNFNNVKYLNKSYLCIFFKNWYWLWYGQVKSQSYGNTSHSG